MYKSAKTITFPLTNVQAAYYIGRHQAYTLGGVATHVYYEFETKIDIERFNVALNKVISIQPMLRTVVLNENEQKILEGNLEYHILQTDMTDWEDDKKESFLLSERKRLSHIVYKTDEWPLFDFKYYHCGDKNLLYFSADLLIADGSSIIILFNEIAKYYFDEDMLMQPLQDSFERFVSEQQDYKASERMTRDRDFWCKQFSEESNKPELLLRRRPEEIRDQKFKRLKHILPKNTWELLSEKAIAHGVSPTMVLFTAYAEILFYWSNQEEYVINFTVSNRLKLKQDRNRVIGDFTSLLLFPVKHRNMDFWEKVQEIYQCFISFYRHTDYDGIDVLKDISKNYHGGRHVLMPVVFTSLLENGEKECQGISWIGKEIFSVSQTPQVYLDCQVMKVDQGVMISWDYVEQLFELDVIENMYNQFMEVIKQVADDKKVSVSLSQEDEKLMTDYNNTNESVTEKTLYKLIYKNFKKYKEKIAVKDDKNLLTYGMLDKLSNYVAQQLVSEHIGKGDFVGISASKCVETIVNIVAVVKCGAGFVPINPEHPDERQQYILKCSDCKHFLKPSDVSFYHISSEPVECSSDGNDTAYIIYTSGSTGMPKGVEISNKAVCNTIEDINERYHVTDKDKLIQISSFCFDLSIYDIFGTLSTGAEMVIVPEVRDISNVYRILQIEQITVWNTVPAIMELLLDEHERYLEDEKKYYWNMTDTMVVLDDTSLRLVMLSGDWIPLSLPDRVKKMCPGVKVYSLGGATEGSIWSIHYPIETIDPSFNSIPYGYPLKNQQIYILNLDGRDCPVGVSGEIYIGGMGVAVGYHNDREKTEEAYIQHEQYGKIYKTGDYGFMHRCGFVEFLGRKDFQVKISGHRIELGEIEHIIRQVPGVTNACVDVRKNENDHSNYLAAYYICDRKIKTADIISFVSGYLPEYMIPKIYMQISEIPLTVNGKVNKKMLPDFKTDNNNFTYVEPRNQLEKLVVSVWEEVLNQKPIGIHDNFFDLGGDSIKVIHIYTKICNEVKVKLQIKDFFDNQTVSSLADYIQSRENINADGENGKTQNRNRLILKEEYQRLIAESNDKYCVFDNGLNHIFLTGGTGFLGAYLIREEVNKVEKLTVLVRGEDLESAEERLKSKLEYYFGKGYFDKIRHKLNVVCGDITIDKFGLNDRQYCELADSVDGILHSAANVSHFGKYEDLYKVNAECLKNIIAFADIGKKKLFHISSSQILGNLDKNNSDGIYTEFNYNVGQTFSDYYCKSKYEAEGILLEAAARGLDVTMFRVGNIVFDSENGYFQENYCENTFYCLLKCIIDLQAAPQSDVKRIDFSYVDQVAKAVSLCVHSLKSGIPVLHIMNENKISINELITLLNSCGYDIQRIDGVEFADRLQILYEMYPNELSIQNIMINAHVWQSNDDAKFTSTLTCRELNQIGYSWPSVTQNNIQCMCNYSEVIGFFNNSRGKENDRNDETQYT